MIINSKIDNPVILQSGIKVIVLESIVKTIYNMRSEIKKEAFLNSKVEPRLI